VITTPIHFCIDGEIGESAIHLAGRNPHPCVARRRAPLIPTPQLTINGCGGAIPATRQSIPLNFSSVAATPCDVVDDLIAVPVDRTARRA